MKFLVQRRQSTSASVTGELLIDDRHFCYTLEPPFALPPVKPRAIPAGTYDLDIRFSPRFARLMPHIENVPDFTDIMLHFGNYPKDTEGCILVGSTIGDNFVGNSQAEFASLFVTISDAVETGPQTISIVDPKPVAIDVDGEITA